LSHYILSYSKNYTYDIFIGSGTSVPQCSEANTQGADPASLPNFHPLIQLVPVFYILRCHPVLRHGIQKHEMCGYCIYPLSIL